jgi:hypothetical protein
MTVILKHRGTGDIRVVEDGWSWSFFLGAGVFGLPLFFRGLPFWGAVMLVAWAARLAIPFLGLADAGALETAHTILVTGLSLFLGMRGNALSIAHYEACGYEREEKDSLDDRIAAQLWDQ